jgi:predicted nucleic acid-binding Zn ribbon protein
MTDAELPEHVAVFERLRSVFGTPGAGRPGRDARRRARAAEDETTVPFGTGRDPRGLDTVLARLTGEMGWTSPLAKSELIVGWPQLVGEETAMHTEPAGIEDGVLVVRCDSTAWAHQMNRMKSAVAGRIAERHPSAGIEAVRFLGPNAPSWKHGPRTVPGRGPRDTYG